MLKQDQIITGTIQHFDQNGNGILKKGKDQILVRQVFLKEHVKVKVVKRLKQGYQGVLLEVLQPDIHRVQVACSIYHKCGSCQLMHMTEDHQSSVKMDYVKALCKKENLNMKVHDILHMEQPFAYRNKIIIGFQKDRNRQIIAGFYEEFSHHIIPYEQCLMHPEQCDEIIQFIVKLMKTFKIEPYDEEKRKGLLRHVVLRYGTISKQIMVVFVLNQTLFPARKHFVDALLKRFPQITTVIQNVNTRKTSIVLGDQERVLYGKGYIEDMLCGLTFRISAKSFYQINHAQTEVLYRTATKLLNLNGCERILDAYCGIGTIGMSIAHKVKQVIGVEINKDAVMDAKVNAKLNKINNINF